MYSPTLRSLPSANIVPYHGKRRMTGLLSLTTRSARGVGKSDGLCMLHMFRPEQSSTSIAADSRSQVGPFFTGRNNGTNMTHVENQKSLNYACTSGGVPRTTS